MSRKIIKKDNKFLARIVTENPKPCAFCHRKVDDEINYGKLYAIGDIQCHYFCALLSCCLVQKGSDNTGLFGFQYKDILAELERCKKHKCSYCGQGGANLGCCVTTCRKQFHLPCGREKYAVSLFYGTFKSFCQLHAPKQKLPDHIMANAKRRKQGIKALNAGNCAKNEKELDTSESMVCVICYEAVDGFPTLETFWPPCCARDAWFHRTCVQRMALSAGMHYLKCPLCNDKEVFYDSVISQGYYVPDRDAAWELEQNAFSEIYERSITCGADDCQCPLGRNHDADNGPWDIKLCLLCGSIGRHQQCITSTCKTDSTSDTFVCATCEPVAPDDLNTLANSIEAVIQEEQAQAASTNRRGPIMPCRMSLRRTKGRNAILNRPSGSRIVSHNQASESTNITSSRLDLNLKRPRKAPTPKKQTDTVPFSPPKLKSYQNSLIKDSFSPTKEQNGLMKMPFSPSKYGNGLLKDQFSPSKYGNGLLKDQFSPSKIIEGLEERLLTGLNEDIVENLRRKIMKPRPMCVKKKIVNETLQSLLNTSPKQKDPLRDWFSPKKHEFDNTKNIENGSPNKEDISTPKKTSTPDKENPIKVDPANEDDSNSTFQLPPEFIADCQSDDSLNFDTPKCKTVEIKQDSSLEIFEKDPDHSIVIQEEQAQAASTNRRGPIMPCRMSLRRTKGRNAILNRPSGSRIVSHTQASESTNITSSRLDLNLKRPRKAPTPKKQTDTVPFSPPKLKSYQNSLIKDSFSPTKEQNGLMKMPFSPSKYGNGLLKDQFSPSKYGNGLLKDQFSPSKIIEGLEERLLTGLNEDIVENLRRKIMKPRPMCVKKKIVNETLQSLLNTSPKQKDPLRDWFSPKKHEFDNTKNIENGSPNKEDISTPKKTSTPDKENPIKVDPANEDDSNSTFQLPPEFIADCQSDDSLNFDTPKCKTVEIKQDSSLEIFEKDPDHSIGIDVIKIENSPTSPPKTSKIPKTDKVFKFSPLGKELVDVEDFKKEYLNEVGFNKVSKSPLKIRTEIDFAVNLANQCENDVKLSKNDKKAPKRRKSDVPNEKVGGKKRKLSESDLVLHYKLSPVEYNENEKQTKNKSKKRKKNKRSDKKLRVTFDSHSKNKKSKLKTKLSVDNKNIKLKIKWKKEQLHLKLESKTEKTKKIKQKRSLNLKQYVLHYPTEGKSTDVLVKPEVDVCPLKRKYIKQEKSPDNFKQTSLHSFFKVKSPNEK